ncbi:hypothetical protein ABK040_006448 [Willaertia magna]
MKSIIVLSIIIALVSQVIANNLIAGGAAAAENEFPHMASLQYVAYSGAKAQHFCGGAIITKKHILTAAHCQIGVSLDKLQVVTGSSNNACQNTICFTRKVVKFTTHASYDPNSIKNDIAIIELDQELPIDSLPTKVRAAKIESGKIPVNTIISAAGWGLIATSQSAPIQLQKATLPIVDQTICNNSPYRLGMTSPQQICAGDGKGIDTCSGDSGGPLFYKNSNGDFVHLGLTSYGPVGCGGTNRGVYTNSTFYIDWIKQQTGSYLIETSNFNQPVNPPVNPTPQPTPKPSPKPQPVPQPTPKPSQKCTCKPKPKPSPPKPSNSKCQCKKTNNKVVTREVPIVMRAGKKVKLDCTGSGCAIHNNAASFSKLSYLVVLAVFVTLIGLLKM